MEGLYLAPISPLDSRSFKLTYQEDFLIGDFMTFEELIELRNKFPDPKDFDNILWEEVNKEIDKEIIRKICDAATDFEKHKPTS